MAYTEDLTTAMTANDAPSPNVTSANSEHAGYQGAWVAFDHNETGDNKWLTDTVASWVKFDFGSALYTITKYTILVTDETEHQDRNPKTWTFKGSNNDSDWDTLDTQTDISFTQHEKKTYTFSNSTSYRYYLLDITAIEGGGDSRVAIQEIEMMRTVLAEDNAIFFGTNF